MLNLRRTIDKALTLTEFGKVVGAIVQFLHHDLCDPVSTIRPERKRSGDRRVRSVPPSFGKVREVEELTPRFSAPELRARRTI